MVNTQFRDFVHATAALPGKLGLTHVTDCAQLAGLAASRILDPKPCSIFGENLVYLFYGRPAYRKSWAGGATSNLDYARICLILKDDVAAGAHRILPFDSGGFDRYNSAFHHSLSLADFEIFPTDSPLQVIGGFYESLAAYWTMNPISNQSFPVTQNVIRSYYSLISGGLAEQFDDRCSAIEIQLANPLPLNGKVLALIGPHQIFDAPDVKAMIDDWGAEPRGYRLTRMFNPPEISGRLFGEVERFLEDRGWL